MTESELLSVSESESDGVVASGVRRGRRRSRGRGRGRGRDRQPQGDGDGGLHPTLPNGALSLTQVIWQPDDDVGVPAASNQWLPQQPNDVSYRAVQ